MGYGNDSWDYAAADYSACVGEEHESALEELASEYSYASALDLLRAEGVLCIADEADVPVEWVGARWPQLWGQIEQESEHEAAMAYADRYTRRAEQGFYDG